MVVQAVRAGRCGVLLPASLRAVRRCGAAAVGAGGRRRCEAAPADDAPARGTTTRASSRARAGSRSRLTRHPVAAERTRRDDRCRSPTTTCSWVEPPKIGLLRAALPPRHRRGADARPSGTCSTSGKADTQQFPEERAEAAAELPRRAPAQPRRAGPRQVRRLLHVLDRLPGPLHRHRRRPVARGRTARSTPRRSSSTSCAASTAACARRPARATPSS